MSVLYITETPGTFRVSFPYHPKMVEVIKRVPGHPQWDKQEKVWIICKAGPVFPPGRDVRWYVESFAKWAVQQHFCISVTRRSH